MSEGRKRERKAKMKGRGMEKEEKRGKEIRKMNDKGKEEWK